MNDADVTDVERLQIAEQVGQRLLMAGLVCSTAESCTGGLIAALLTETAGSSAWFDSAAITYSNEAKQRMLGVPVRTLSEHGAVSQACVEAMAAGSLERSNTDLAVSVSGIAGPGGGSADKPVGTVWLAWAWYPVRPGPVSIEARVFEFAGDRQQVRAQAATEALRGMIRVCDAAGI